jgi:hypothetical protein
MRRLNRRTNPKTQRLFSFSQLAILVIDLIPTFIIDIKIKLLAVAVYMSGPGPVSVGGLPHKKRG